MNGRTVTTGEGLIRVGLRADTPGIVRRLEALVQSEAVRKLLTESETAKREKWLKNRSAPAPQPTTAKAAHQSVAEPARACFR